MELSGQLIPQIKPEEQLRPGWREELLRKLEDRWNPPFEIPNIHFHYYHDDFFNRHLSVRAARDWRNHPFWFYIACLFFLSLLATSGITISFRLLAPHVPYLPNAI